MMTSSLLHISPGAVVCNESQLVGEVSVGARTVIHPKAKILAEAGPIIIGENNLIEEQATIVNAKREDGGGGGGGSVPVMIVGNNNVFEVDSHSQALKIGDNNILESKCRVGRQVELSNGCVVGAGCTVEAQEVNTAANLLEKVT